MSTQRKLEGNGRLARSPEPTSAGPSLHERIARRAYELYQERGRQNGRDMDDWLEAERQVRQEVRPRPTPDPGSRASRPPRSSDGQRRSRHP